MDESADAGLVEGEAKAKAEVICEIVATHAPQLEMSAASQMTWPATWKSLTRGRCLYTVYNMHNSNQALPALKYTHSSAEEFVLERLQNWIVEGWLKPGQELKAESLARRLGVSRTPVREAIRALQSQGYVSRNRGTTPRVLPLSSAHVEQLYLVRSVVEGLAAYYACSLIRADQIANLKSVNAQLKDSIQQMDPIQWTRNNLAFHRSLYSVSNMPFIVNVIEPMLGISSLYMITLARFVRPRIITACDEHEEIISSLESGDASRTQELVTAHVRKGGPVLADYLRACENHDIARTSGNLK